MHAWWAARDNDQIDGSQRKPRNLRGHFLSRLKNIKESQLGNSIDEIAFKFKEFLLAALRFGMYST